ncbi:MAG TPA: hypothetical protein VHC01_05680 [Gaiellaceae bacterium]|nr:hypothetical protein [Gaiellaceae bacterium]
MATIGARYRVLAAGFDELNLWELPGRHIFVHSGGRSVTADLQLGDVREALSEALRAGFVLLYDPEGPGHPALALEDALALVADDDEWDLATSSRRVALAITPSGEAVLHRVSDEYRRASPFRTLEIVDPQVIDGETHGS